MVQGLPRTSRCIFKQYIGDIKKPLHLHGIETIQVTLSGSLGFVVALAWNEFFKEVFKKMSDTIESKSQRLVLYAMAATVFLFVFNMGVGAAVSHVRSHEQQKAVDVIKKKKALKL